MTDKKSDKASANVSNVMNMPQVPSMRQNMRTALGAQSLDDMPGVFSDAIKVITTAAEVSRDKLSEVRTWNDVRASYLRYFNLDSIRSDEVSLIKRVIDSTANDLDEVVLRIDNIKYENFISDDYEDPILSMFADASLIYEEFRDKAEADKDMSWQATYDFEKEMFVLGMVEDAIKPYGEKLAQLRFTILDDIEILKNNA